MRRAPLFLLAAVLLAAPSVLATDFSWEGDASIQCLFRVQNVITSCTAANETALPSTATGTWTLTVTWTSSHEIYDELTVFFGIGGPGPGGVSELKAGDRENGASPVAVTLPANAEADHAFFQISPAESNQIVFVAPPGVPTQTIHYALTHAD